MFEGLEVKALDLEETSKVAAEITKKASDLAEDTWKEFSESDASSSVIDEAKKAADEAWKAGAPAIEAGAAAVSDSVRNVTYIRGRTALGVAKPGENAYKAVKTFWEKTTGDDEAAVDIAQHSAVDEWADSWGDALDVSEEVETIGDGAEVVGEVVGGAGIAVAAIALAPEGAAMIAVGVGVDAMFALGVSGEVLEAEAADGELTNEEMGIAVGAGAGTAVLGAGAGKIAGKIFTGIKKEVSELAGKGMPEKTAELAAEAATREVAESAAEDAAKATAEGVADVIAKETGETALKEAAEDIAKVFADDAGRTYRVGDDLIPSNEYEINGYKYKTDEMGRIESAEGKLHLRERDRMNIKDDMKVIGKNDELETDQRGHLIADWFDGSNGLENIVSMDGELNQGAFRRLETRLAESLKNGDEVFYKIEVTYAEDTFRPNGFCVTDVVNGRTTMTFFRNSTGVF